jgi:hypothetical protein
MNDRLLRTTVVLSVLLLTGVAVAGVAGAADTVDNGQFSTDPVDESTSFNNEIVSYDVNNVDLSDGNTDEFNLTVPNEIAEASSLSINQAFLYNSSNASDGFNGSLSTNLVDGPDGDGVSDTLQITENVDTGDADQNLTVRFDYDFSTPGVVSGVDFDYQASVTDSTDSNVGLTGIGNKLKVQDTNAGSQTITVEADETPGDSDDVFATITDAIDNATAGDTVQVDASGSPYEEQVTVDNDITLESINGQAKISDDTGNNAPAVKITADGATVTGFEVERDVASADPYAQSIQVENAKNVEVSDNLLTTANLSDTDNSGGLLIQASDGGDAGSPSDTSNVTVENNIIDGADLGIYVDADGQEVTGLSVTGNDVSNVDSAEFILGMRGSGTIGTVNGESETNAQITAVLNDNSGIDTTNPYAVEVTPADVTVGNSETVEATILGRDDADPRVADVGVNVRNTSGNNVSDSSTSSNTFSTLVGFNEVGDYGVVLPGEAGAPFANISSLYAVAGFETQPANPVFGDDAQVSGQVVSGNGDGVDVGTLNLVNVDNESTTGASTSTTGSGNFSFTAAVDDAATFGIGTNADEVFAEFDVGPETADLVIEANNTATFDQKSTFTVELTDLSGDGIDTNSGINGYVNVTGPFTSKPTVDVDGGVKSSTDDYVRVQTNGTGVIQLNATPTGNDVTASLERVSDGDRVSGLEETNPETNATADYTAEDASVAVEQLDSINVNVPDEIDVGTSDQEVSISVTGNDGNLPGAGDSLVNATVSVSGPNIDNETTVNDSKAKFPVLPDEGGTITVEATAVNRSDGAELGPVTDEITVNGDRYENLTPTSADIETTTDVGIDLSNADGVGLNNRNVTFEHSSSGGFNVTDADGNFVTGDTLRISGTEGEVLVGSGTLETVEDIVSVNAGEYLATDVSFDKTGTVSVTAEDNSGATVYVEEAFSVTGVDVYEITSDVNPVLAGTNEVHNFTVTEDGAPVNGTELENLNLAVKQEGADITESSVTAINTTGDSASDALQVDVLPTTPDSQVNVTVEDGEGRSGETTLDALAPDVETNLTDNTLTHRIASTVEVTVNDPRDGERLEGADLQVSALNGTVEANGSALSGEAKDSADGPDSTTTVATGTDIADSNATVDLLAYDPANDGFEVVLSAKSAGAASFVPAATLDAERMDFTVDPTDITFSAGSTVVEVEGTLANGLPLADQDFEANGAGVSLDDVATDGTGAQTVQVNPQATGTIEFSVDNDSEVVPGTESPSQLTEATINVTSERRTFDLTVSPTSVTANQSTEVTVTALDANTSNPVEGATVNLTGVGVDQTVTTDANGEANVTVEPNAAGTVDVIVTDADYNEATASITVEQSQLAADVTFDDSTVQNGTETVTVDSAEYTLADGSDGEFQVAVHVVNDDGTISSVVGISGNQTGATQDIAVDLNATGVQGDALDTLTENETLRAMLHETGEPFGTPIEIDGDRIIDDANITVVEDVEPAPADLQVSNVQPDGANVTAGDDITVTADIENVGGQSGSQTAEFRLDLNQNGTLEASEELANKTVTVDAGNNTTVTFENVSTEGLEAGTYDHGVFTANDSATATVTVEEETALFTEPLIEDFNAPPENTGELDDTLYEDLNGDGDGLDVNQTVSVFGELIRGTDLGLSEEQGNALDWNNDGPEVTIQDMVALFGEQIRE